MSRFFTWLGDVFQSCIDGVINFFGALWDIIWGILCACGQYFIDFVLYCYSWLVYIIAYIFDFGLCALIGLLHFIGGFFSFEYDFQADLHVVETLASINTFFPLEDLVNSWCTLALCLIVHICYCFIKSWIPGIAGR